MVIFFRDVLYRGNRSVKADSFGLAAFDSPRCPSLAQFSITVQIDWKLIKKSSIDSRDDLIISTVHT